MPASTPNPRPSVTPVWDSIVDEFPAILSLADLPPDERRIESRRRRSRCRSVRKAVNRAKQANP